jgi:tetratricopeptide (TPR) repeat protein
MTGRRQQPRPGTSRVIGARTVGRRIAHLHSGVLPMPVSFVLPRRAIRVALLAIASLPALATAQSAADHIAVGDRDHTAMNAPSALHHYEEAMKLEPKSYEALWKATREAVDVGEYAPRPQRDSLYTLAEQYARRAVEANSSDAEGHFHLARALGRKALSLGKKDQVKYARDVRLHALESLKRNPKHPGALHVMGMWNYNVMKLSGMARFMAKTFLGGQVFDSANWNDAQRYMEESVTVDPVRLVHHLDLARVYVARGDAAKAREQYELTIRGTQTEYNDRHYQAEATEELKSLQ